MQVIIIVLQHALMTVSAVTTIVYASIRSYWNSLEWRMSDHRNNSGDSDGKGDDDDDDAHGGDGDDDDENDDSSLFVSLWTRIPIDAVQYIDMRTAYMFPLISSISLLVLFFFMEYLYLFMCCLIMLYAVFGVTYSLNPLSFKLLLLIRGYGNIKIIHKEKRTLLLKQSTILSLLFGICSVMLYLYTNWWFLNNLLGFGLIVTFISCMKLPNIKVAFVLLLGLFIYDIFWVFFSENVPIFNGENVMVAVATRIDLPLKYKIPATGFNAVDFSILGMGDIVLPGLLLSFCFDLDVHKKTIYDWKQSYFVLLTFCYTIGLMFTYFCLHVFHAAQPALLYLVPSTLIPLMVAGFLRNDINLLWNGVSKRHDIIRRDISSLAKSEV
jgi:hypothetical protein